jgi:uncharacterized protein YjdB
MTALAETGPVAAPGPVLVESVKFPASKLTLVKGTSYTLAAAVSPDGAADKNVSYTSSNTAVASVDINTGEITAKKAGTAVITAAAGDLSGMKASYTLTVINKLTLKVSLAKQSYKVGETVKKTAVITGGATGIGRAAARRSRRAGDLYTRTSAVAPANTAALAANAHQLA